MAKKYLDKGGSKFLFLGRSQVRVALISHVSSPHIPGRIIKMLHVQEVVKQNPSNPIGAGSILAISFPENKANCKEYEWSAGEQFQAPIQPRKE